MHRHILYKLIYLMQILMVHLHKNSSSVNRWLSSNLFWKPENKAAPKQNPLNPCTNHWRLDVRADGLTKKVPNNLWFTVSGVVWKLVFFLTCPQFKSLGNIWSDLLLWQFHSYWIIIARSNRKLWATLSSAYRVLVHYCQLSKSRYKTVSENLT